MGRAFEVRKASMMKTGAAKAKLFSRRSKEIYMVAKKGGADPDSNPELKRVIDKCKRDHVSSDVISRAIEKAKGAGGEDYKLLRYEGFTPNNGTIIVDCLTDNPNRSFSDVKLCFTKSNNKMGVSGSVAHMYRNVTIGQLKGVSEDEFMELLIENEIDPLEFQLEENILEVVVDIKETGNLNSLLDSHKEIEVVNLETVMDPISYIDLSDEEDLKSFNKLITMLEDVDDVQEIYHNVIVKE